MERLIFHVDVNSAFLSWEAAKRVKCGEPDLRLVPSCIGGDPKSRRGIVLAKSIPAKQYGIKTGEPLSMALRKCPNLIVAPPNFKLYSDNSRAFKSICRSYTSLTEEFSIDECFLDFSGTSHLYPDPVALATEIKDRIRDELGFTVNVGIGRNKLCAKMASDFEKPDKVHTLFPEEIPAKMWLLPVGDLLYIGKASVAKLSEAKIRTIGDLAKADLNLLSALLGEKTAKLANAYANGIDSSPVREAPEEAKGYSNSITTEENISTIEQANMILLSLCDSVTEHMRSENTRAGGVSVGIRYLDFKNRSHQMKLESPTDSASIVYETAKKLLAELWKDRLPLRLMSVALTNVSKGQAVRQLSLFDEPEKQINLEKQERLDKAVSAIRGKFGFDAIQRGALINSDYGVGRKFKGKKESERSSDAEETKKER
ncbi:MAG: DNA polymerase IV [Clostridia bacterium]|nr:DNA polymerase IV [Clostridia bacterium]